MNGETVLPIPHTGVEVSQFRPAPDEAARALGSIAEGVRRAEVGAMGDIVVLAALSPDVSQARLAWAGRELHRIHADGFLGRYGADRAGPQPVQRAEIVAQRLMQEAVAARVN